MRLLLVLCACLLFVGCAKHGVYIKTDKDYKGHVSIGWGPMAIVDMEVMGATQICVPSKSAVKEDASDNWCTKFDKPPLP